MIRGRTASRLPAPRRRNLWAPAGFLLSAGAFVSYYLVLVRFPVTRDVPWVPLLLLAGAVGLCGIGLARAWGRNGTRAGKVAASLSTLLTLLVAGTFVFLNLVGSKRIPVSAGAPAAGAPAPAVTLLDMSGAAVPLASAWGGPGREWALLVFYRGYW